MRTIAMALLLTLFNTQFPTAVDALDCDQQVVVLFQLGIPLLALLLLLDLFNLVARQLERRQRRERQDLAWLEEWVERVFRLSDEAAARHSNTLATPEGERQH